MSNTHRTDDQRDPTSKPGGPPPSSSRAPGPIARVLALPCIGLIWLYRITLSPWIGGQCRFEPTCSRYAMDAYRGYGLWRGTSMTLRRVLRCHPLSKGGYDPVPIPGPAPGDESPETIDENEPSDKVVRID